MSLRTINNRIFLGIAIVLVVLGLVTFIEIPLSMLQNNNPNTSKTCVWELGDCNVSIPTYAYYLRDNTKYHELETTISGSLSFDTSEVFSAYNPFHYNIGFSADHPQFIKHIFLLMDFNNKNNFNSIDNVTFDDIQPSMKIVTSEVTPMDFRSNPFVVISLYNTGSNQFFNYNQTEYTDKGNFTLTPMIVDNNNVVHIGQRIDPIFELKDNRYKQLADENIRAKIDSNTNLALAWVVVTITPIIVGADFFGRIFIKES